MIASQLGTYTPDAPGGVTLPSRTGAYAEAYAIPLTNKEWATADEGSYFTVANPSSQTGITGTIITSLDTTKPCLFLYNGTTKRMYPQFLSLVITTASTTGTTGGFTLVPFVDVGNLYTSGGTALTIASNNIAATAVSTGLVAYAGALTVVTATSQAINYGDVCFRYTTADIIGDHYDVVFGAPNSNGGARTKPATLCDISRSASPIVVPPGCCLKVYQWRATQDGAPVFQLRMGIVLR